MPLKRKGNVGAKKSNKKQMKNWKEVVEFVDRNYNFKESKNKRHNSQGGNMKEENRNVNMGQQANAGLARDDSRTATRLLDKHFSPLIVRKYQMEGWPLFVSLITDCNLNDLDEVVHSLSDQARELGFMDGNIQSARNYTGFLCDGLVKHYDAIKKGSVEGVLCCFYCDKNWCSAAFGDLMTHEKCVNEVYHIINTLPHI